MAKKFILITGHSGAGKTTVINELRESIRNNASRLFIDLDIFGYRNNLDKWVIDVGLAKAVASRKTLIGAGTSSNIQDIIPVADVVYLLWPELSHEHAENIRQREIDRGVVHKGESIDDKLAIFGKDPESYFDDGVIPKHVIICRDKDEVFSKVSSLFKTDKAISTI